MADSNDVFPNSQVLKPMNPQKRMHVIPINLYGKRRFLFCVIIAFIIKPNANGIRPKKNSINFFMVTPSSQIIIMT